MFSFSMFQVPLEAAVMLKNQEKKDQTQVPYGLLEAEPLF